MNKKKKYYVVWCGRSAGIFHSWEECKEQIKGFSGAKYKSFNTIEEAEKSFANGYENTVKESKKSLSYKSENEVVKKYSDKPVKESICVDAACSESGIMEYRGVFLKTGKQLFHKGPYEGASNNIGEFLAIVHVLSYMKKNNYNYVVYTDSVTAISWVKKKRVKTKIQPSDQILSIISRAIIWLNYNSIDEYKILKWQTAEWGEIPADFGRK